MNVYLIAGNSCEALQKSLENTGDIKVVGYKKTLGEGYDDLYKNNIKVNLILLLDHGIDCSEQIFQEWLEKYYVYLQNEKKRIEFKFLTKFSEYQQIFLQTMKDNSNCMAYLSDRVKVPVSMIIQLCSSSDISSLEDTVILNHHVEKNNPVEILDNDQRPKIHIKGTIIISVTGIESGVGCTHTSITIAHYLMRHKEGCSIAVMDLHNGDMNSLNNDCSEALTAGSFQYNNIHFYDNTISVAELIGLKYYDYIVQDLGPLETDSSPADIAKEEHSSNADLNKNYSEMLRSHLSIIVTNSQPWQIRNLKRILLQHWKGGKLAKDFVLFCTLTNDIKFQEIVRTIDSDAVKAAYNPELFENSDEQDQVLCKLLQPLIVGAEVANAAHDNNLNSGLLSGVQDTFVWIFQNMLKILVMSLKFGWVIAVICIIYFLYIK